MTTWSEYQSALVSGASGSTAAADRDRPGHYGDVDAEYRALAEGPAVVDRAYRGLIEVRGADRTHWLHNLTTNEVKNLAVGEGNHACALNAQGRILLDLNLSVRADSIWLDIDRASLPVAHAHFDKYLITEDVSLTDRSDDFVRIGLAGENVKDLLRQWGAGHVATMPWFGTDTVSWDDATFTVMRNDFAGTFGVDLFVSADQAVTIWERLTGPIGGMPVGDEAVQVRRIEAGMPWPGHEITDEYLPAEIGRFEQTVSISKGCYLGQEVVERMRSRDVVARRMVGLVFPPDSAPDAGAALADERGDQIGKVTSVCHSQMMQGPIGLGFVKTALASDGTALQCRLDPEPVPAAVVALPFSAAHRNGA